MWMSNKIYISECKLSQYDIFNTILRPNLDLPQFGALMFKKLSVAELDEVIRPLVVNDRNGFNQTGFFIPCPNFHQLNIYSNQIEEFDNQIMNHARWSIENLFQIDPSNFN
jgi:hypothetical protein